MGDDGESELTLLLVNKSPKEHVDLRDTNLYECALEIEASPTKPFILESLPDSFRYDRRVSAYGLNCGVEVAPNGAFRTSDTIGVEKRRPTYWNVPTQAPDLSFETLANSPIPELDTLRKSLRTWGAESWSEDELWDRAAREGWDDGMLKEALSAASLFWEECDRVATGVKLLQDVPDLLLAFKLMNRAMLYSANGKYSGWRPFQIGFLLASLTSITEPETESEIADVVWFATGGGKTETYLGLLVVSALLERMRGKLAGITAWSRFPLRMLSLQQTQRFADAMAGAERVRRERGIPGDPFAVGFLVGQDGTPNTLKEDAQPPEPDVDDDEMPERYRVLLKCPFCHRDTIKMVFDRRFWRLAHQCTNEDCTWPEEFLPFYIVDDEIYRFLPTVVVGTLDKAASIGMQAGMRGLVGSPLGICSEVGHGFTYAPRSSRPNGCLVPGCPGRRKQLPLTPAVYAPAYRLQDELHLLKDSLGAVDSHYESLLDHLEMETSGRRPKILGSSATLTGYERQIRLLYDRMGRVFPTPGPSAKRGFWTAETPQLGRRYVAVAPRGVTLEYAVDRTITELQRIVRDLVKDPASVCAAAGVEEKHAADLVSLYGTDVVYGNTLRDLDAVSRSLETQVGVQGPLNTASLTGKTAFTEVRSTLDRLERPESSFDDRLHVVTASSMMSHGVDIDRLNVMVMLGIPLGTAEFIQASARVGRRLPGIVYVIHKIARERDASVFRCFEKFVQQGDRFVEPIPVTRRSRRVMERTIAGLALARILAIHEPASGEALTTVKKLRQFVQKQGITADREADAVISMLGFANPLDEGLRGDLRRWYERFFENLIDPSGSFKFPSDLGPSRPMRSLRDVEEEVPIRGI